MTIPAQSTRERVLAYDLLRVFAAATVVTIHVLAPYMKAAGPFAAMSPVNLFDQALHYAVPMFTFLSGALSWGAVWGAGPGRYRRFLRRRWLVVGLPYLVWTILYFFLRPAGGYPQAAHSILGGIWQFLVLLVSGNVWYHLYFMPMILVLYLLTPLASRAVHKAPEVFIGVFLLFIVYVIPWALTYYSAMPLHKVLGPMILPLIASLTTYSPFMALGAWFAVRQQHLWRALRWGSVPLLALAVALLVLFVGHPMAPGRLHPGTWLYIVDMSVFVFGFLGVASALSEMRPFAAGSAWAGRTVTLASLTLGVYMVHPIVVTFVGRKLLDSIGLVGLWTHLSFVMAFDAFAVVAVFATVYALKKWKPTSYLV